MYDEVSRRRSATEPAGPDAGRGLVEHVAQLAGETWTDRPSCVHPTLGAVARAVEDHSSEPGTAMLRALAPRFIGTAHQGFETPARLVAICVSTALASPDQERITPDERRRLSGARRTALYLLGSRAGPHATVGVAAQEEPRLCGATRWWMPVLERVGLSEPLYRCFVAEEHAAEAVAVTARASGDDRDRRLRHLLSLCVAATGHGGQELPDLRSRRRRLPTDSRRTPPPE